ncbi:MAG: pyridoxal phosphate-dependent aminotransferase [Candidatus Marinimicrobia bacterium]|nr:pyridoxal phosphate-dependent aminotransferase [Candidatus Neomarinimicrobiota bacterium]
MKFAESMSRLGTETAFEVLARARVLEGEGRSIIHLEIGEPDFDTPANIRDAAKKALDEGHTHYGPSAGIPALREAIANEIGRSRGVEVSPQQVVVVPGGKPIIFFSLLACVNPGDEVIYPNPGFPIYESVINWIGAKAVPLPIREENSFGIDVSELEALITPRTKFLILNSPANPTGAVATGEQLARIAELAIEHDFIVLADEIYSRIIYGGEHLSLLTFPGMAERLILLDGFSKTYAMTGWRLGYGVMPEELAFWVGRLMTNSNSCTASFTQIAGVEALTGPQDEARAMVAEFERRRDIIVSGLNAIDGITCLQPEGAFYVFPNIKALGRSSKKLEEYFLEECGVAMLTGTSFGALGEGYIRLSYANSIENINEALSRINDGVARL